MAREIKVRGLDVALVDGGGDEDVHLALLEVVAGAVEALTAEGAGHLGALAKVYLDLLLREVDDVIVAVLSLGSVLDSIECHLLRNRGEELLVVGSHLGGAVKDGCAEVEHAAVAEGLDDDFVANTVEVAVSDGDAYLFLFVIVHYIDDVYFLIISCIWRKA